MFARGSQEEQEASILISEEITQNKPIVVEREASRSGSVPIGISDNPLFFLGNLIEGDELESNILRLVDKCPISRAGHRAAST